MDHIWKREKPSIRNGAHLPSKRVTFALQNGAHLLFKAVVPSTQGGPQVLKVGRRHPSRRAAGIPQGLPQVLMKVCRRHPSRWPTICHPARPRHFPPGWCHLGSRTPLHPNRHLKQVPQTAPSPVAIRHEERTHFGNEPYPPLISDPPSVGASHLFFYIWSSVGTS